MGISGKVVFICILFLLTTKVSSGKEAPYTLEDRDRLIRIEATLKEFKDAVDKRFEQFENSVDKRFEQVDKRLEQVDKRFEQLDKRFEEITTFMWMLVTIFIAITGATIGFALWDRRTMIRPFEIKVKDIRSEIEIEKGKIEKLILSLRELAKNDAEVAAVLKKFSLL